MTTPADEARTRRRNAIHHVSGVTIDCCEQGETDCPCICHDDEPRVSIVHASPPDGSGLTPCCGRTPFELPQTDRITRGPGRVTCNGGGQP